MIFNSVRARRAATVVLSGGLLLTASPLASPAQAKAAVPTITAKSGYVMDYDSGVSIYSKDAHTTRQMASTTKIATAITVLTTPGVDLNRKVTVKSSHRDYVIKQGGSTADLKPGDTLTVRQLLYGLMLPSGCDAAYALAETFGTGNSPNERTRSFVAKMNAKAASLGLKKTKFDSFDGISQRGQNYTTAADLTKLARHAYANGTFRDIVKATSYKAPATTSTGAARTYTWYNTNKLLGSYSGATGVKTGTGTAAGPCLTFTASRNGKTYIGVLLNGAGRYDDAAKLLDYGFGSTSAKTMKLRTLPEGAQQD
ncbi:D-alanyl-D-alanine carboxypeptidase family protein [Streptomyces sp. NPDC020412]|uniref:D-alanyl-D-alanine carboxypeptidase family protein n=1 Tax=Streptomyces sp. NPDC020412 TaxID=3365073 RepID=UPI0037897B13